jgi:hypothetical protein
MATVRHKIGPAVVWGIYSLLTWLQRRERLGRQEVLLLMASPKTPEVLTDSVFLHILSMLIAKI